MTPITEAFRRWLAAEKNVHDAQCTLLKCIHAWDPELEARQKIVLVGLRGEASRLLREYLDSMENEVTMRNHQAKKRPHEAGKREGWLCREVSARQEDAQSVSGRTV